MKMTCFSKECGKGLTLICLEHSNIQQWLSATSKVKQRWIASNYPSGPKPGQTLLLPDQKGDVSEVLYIYRASDGFWSFAKLYQALPENLHVLLPDALSYQQQLDFMLLWAMSDYRYYEYKTDDAKKGPVLCVNDSQYAMLQDEVIPLVESMYQTRDLINKPCEDLTPKMLADVAQNMAHQFGAQCHVMEDLELIKEEYPLVHAVGRSAVNPPRVITMTWGDPNHYKLGLVGKGVCYDTGGLNLKPGASMTGMKKDMGGAALVLGLAHWIMARELPVHFKLIIPAVENAIGGGAYRPGDIFFSRQGQSVHIGNTDAEGRLILADALTAIQDSGPMDLLIDFATLTGAQRIALGPDIPGFFSTSQAVTDGLMQASKKVDDPVWPLPLYEPYSQWLDHEIADMNNIGSVPLGGSIVAALFLKKFVTEDQAWVHVDFNASNHKDMPARPKGGEAQSLRAWAKYLEHLVSDR